MVTIHPAFAVPLGDAHYEGAPELNAQLRDLILSMESVGERHRNPHPVVHQPAGLYESTFDFFARPETCVQTLRAWVWNTLGEFVRRLNPSVEAQPKGLRISSQTWFHVTRSGGYFGYHNHPMASWSGVYCVDNGDPDPELDNNGCLVFPHPLVHANAFLDAANSTLRWPYTQGNFVLNLSPGQMVLFPSWLGHYVTPFVGQRERITVAFNAWFNRQG